MRSTLSWRVAVGVGDGLAPDWAQPVSSARRTIPMMSFFIENLLLLATYGVFRIPLRNTLIRFTFECPRTPSCPT